MLIFQLSSCLWCYESEYVDKVYAEVNSSDFMFESKQECKSRITINSKKQRRENTKKTELQTHTKYTIKNIKKSIIRNELFVLKSKEKLKKNVYSINGIAKCLLLFVHYSVENEKNIDRIINNRKATKKDR